MHSINIKNIVISIDVNSNSGDLDQWLAPQVFVIDIYRDQLRHDIRVAAQDLSMSIGTYPYDIPNQVVVRHSHVGTVDECTIEGFYNLKAMRQSSSQECGRMGHSH